MPGGGLAERDTPTEPAGGCEWGNVEVDTLEVNAGEAEVEDVAEEAGLGREVVSLNSAIHLRKSASSPTLRCVKHCR
jgi:hypothetical protein